MREAIGAEEAYVICAGDPYFTRIGDDNDPRQYEIKQRGYWVVWRQLAAAESATAAAFTVVDRIVTEGGLLGETNTCTHVACILPGDESNSEMLVVRGPWPDGLGEDMTNFLEAARPVFAYLVAAVLDTERQARHQIQLSALAGIARAFSEAHEVSNVLQSVATAMAKAAAIDWVTITLVNEDCTEVIDRATNLNRFSNTETADLNVRGESGEMVLPVAQALGRRRRPYLYPDVAESDMSDALKAYHERGHIISVATFGLVFQDKLLGSVSFASSVKREWGAAEIGFLSDLVSQAATTIKGLRLYQELEEASRIQHFLARTDPLTGIPNRRYIEEVLRAECARAQRYSEPVSVVMADLDYFKLVNDTYGHDAGDEALKHVAGIARESCRESDFVGRWGGDEFMFILPVTPLDGGMAFAERFRSSLSDSIFVPRDGRDPWKIGLSAGVAEASVALYPKADSLFQLADAALYRAKESGRNRVLAAAIRAAAA